MSDLPSSAIDSALPLSGGAGLSPTAAFELGVIGDGLSFAASLGALADALAGEGAAAVVQAPPGTGKTTLVPPAVANLVGASAGAGAAGRVVVTQPRRVAARAAARRLAQLTGTRLGDRVGYAVRGDRQGGAGTLIEFVTPGLLLRRLIADPGLDGVAAVVVDEVHERALDTDLLLGLLGEVRLLREDLRVVAMSATLDAPRFAALLGGETPAPLVDCPSALYPLEVRWAPPRCARMGERGPTQDYLRHLARVTVEAHVRALQDAPEDDALVFVPGAREVDAVARYLRDALADSPHGIDVLPLHGQIPAADQDRAVSGRGPGEAPRIVVSTALAESSLTVPGVRLVVDSGLSREPRRDAARGMTGLVTVQASRASCDQRAGRAARQGPGVVIRCFEEKSLAAAPAHVTPEIAASDLTEAALTLACWGAPEAKGLALPDAPPAAAMKDAVDVLTALGAVDDSGQATDLGRRLAAVPADPRLARALYDGATRLGARVAAEGVALLASALRSPGADAARLLAQLRRGETPESRSWRQEVDRFERLAEAATRDAATSRPTPRTDVVLGDKSPIAGAGRAMDGATTLGFLAALAHPEWVARRVGDSSTYLFASGTRAALPPESSLAGHDWLAVAEVSRAEGRAAAGTGAVIRAAAPVSQDQAEEAAEHLLTDRVEAEFRVEVLRARRERRLGRIVLSSTPVAPEPEQGRAAVVRALQEHGLGVIGFDDAAEALRRRLAFLRRELGEPWPDVAEPALLARLEEWLTPEIGELAAGEKASRMSLAAPLSRLLPWPEAARLEELAPERLEVPSGSRIRVEYPEVGDAGAPVMAVKLQECFGWAETPRLAEGRAPVLFHLLSPAGRPLAVTDDLESFWSGPYAQVRAEMRGRYPKHPWPEDPWNAQATARTKRWM